MLEFIVLGQIPGTSVQITYEQVLLLGIIVALGIEIFTLRKRQDGERTQTTSKQRQKTA